MHSLISNYSVALINRIKDIDPNFIDIWVEYASWTKIDVEMVGAIWEGLCNI